MFTDERIHLDNLIGEGAVPHRPLMWILVLRFLGFGHAMPFFSVPGTRLSLAWGASQRIDTLRRSAVSVPSLCVLTSQLHFSQHHWIEQNLIFLDFFVHTDRDILSYYSCFMLRKESARKYRGLPCFVYRRAIVP